MNLTIRACLITNRHCHTNRQTGRLPQSITSPKFRELRHHAPHTKKKKKKKKTKKGGQDHLHGVYLNTNGKQSATTYHIISMGKACDSSHCLTTLNQHMFAQHYLITMLSLSIQLYNHPQAPLSIRIQ